MARSKQKKNKDKASNTKAKGTYGSNLSTPNTRSKSKEKEKRKSSSKADAKSKATKKPKSKDKPKSKSKHPKHQFSKDSIKQRLTAASSKSAKKANPFKRPPTERPRKRKKPQRIEFQMNIPDSNHDYFLKPENVPWYNAQNQERFRENYSTNHVVSSSGSLTTTSTIRPSSEEEEGLQLPSETVLANLDTEIQSFSAYVRLTPSERRARDAFLSHITEILTTQFANGGGNTRGGYRKKSDSDDIYVEPFGSYATPQVCTFASDVDMCLWGLVKEEERPNSHLKFVSSDSNEGDDEGDAVLNTNRGGECPLLTESSLLRTMDAIQSAQAASRRPAAEKLKSETEIAAASDDCLFVIDRVGVNMENLEEKEKMPTEDIANAKVQSTDEGTLQKEPDSEQTSNKKQSVQDQPKSKSKKKNLLKEQFEFVIDVDGVQELGGDVEDLPDFTEKVQGASDKIETTTDKFSQEKKNEEKVEEPTLDMTAAEERVASGKTKQNNLDGKSHDKVINLDDDSSEDEVIVVDDDSVDEADKLDSFYSRQSSNGVSENAKTHSPPREAVARSSGENDVISVGDSSDESDDDNIANYRRDEVLELSVTSNSITSKPIVKPVFGPTGKTRVRVVSVLQGLTSHLRRSSFTNTVECRSRARVPIINCNTRTGFEGDIAIGGHNGVDTSTYAQRQADRFQSFASIVLVLKVLMVQQGLDKPFTGGLGSYKLYVLVAHHIEHHLANGGNDRPSEILISLLFRYSCIGPINDKATTDLESIRNAEGLIASDDGVCDLSPVFRIPDLVEMFRECHERLFDRMLLAEGFDDKVCNNLSYLSSMIDCFRLKEARESSDRRSKISDEITRPIGRDHPGKVSASRKIGKVFSKSEYGSGALKRQIPTSFLDNGSNKKRQSYSDSQPKRGPRGGLIPLYRPDVAAMKSIRSNPEKELLLRGTKNRKNKKKQNRDDALRIFSRRSI